jgi:methanogenesis multiheme c-type cytochrome
MLEKWCALPNFSYYQQDGITGWTTQSCNGCHIGASWNPTRDEPLCIYCHVSAAPVANDGDVPTIAKCLTCHSKDTAKRGDVFTPEEDVHINLGFVCQDCHWRETDALSDHQFRKGTAMDTTEQTMMGTMSCTMSTCHDAQPHSAVTDRGIALNTHNEKVACETCHTGLRPAAALASRQWNVFNEAGAVKTTKHAAGWLPVHKWYDNTGPGAAGNYDLPILGYTERRDADGAKIYPFNAVTVDWYVKKKKSDYDEVIIVPEVKAADADGDGTVTLAEMQKVYRKAVLKTADMNFSISHSVVPASQAFVCNDCHGRNAWVLDWKQLGYAKDPRSGGDKKSK